MAGENCVKKSFIAYILQPHIAWIFNSRIARCVRYGRHVEGCMINKWKA
jgi:hypothetical protein